MSPRIIYSASPRSTVRSIHYNDRDDHRSETPQCASEYNFVFSLKTRGCHSRFPFKSYFHWKIYWKIPSFATCSLSEIAFRENVQIWKVSSYDFVLSIPRTDECCNSVSHLWTELVFTCAAIKVSAQCLSKPCFPVPVIYSVMNYMIFFPLGRVSLKNSLLINLKKNEAELVN